MTSPKQLSRRTTFGLSVLGGCLLWTAFPPLNWTWMAWLAPCLWMPLLTAGGFKPSPSKRRSRRIMGNGYFQMWLAHVLFWLLLLQGLRLAHWTTHFGWLALAMYLGVYLPAFVFVGRQLIRHTRLPASLAAAISWVSLEWLRGYVISGFSLGCLSHTQTEHLTLIQIADLTGSPTISMLIILVAGNLYAIVTVFHKSEPPIRPQLAALMHVSIIFVLVFASLVYGQQRLRGSFADMSNSVTVGLIQGSADTQFGLTYEQYLKKMQRQQQTYIRQSELAREFDGTIQLLVWPESMFSYGPNYLLDKNHPEAIHVPRNPEFEDFSKEDFKEHVVTVMQNMENSNALLMQRLHAGVPDPETVPTQLIAGANTRDLSVTSTPLYNSAIRFDPNGNILDIYHKSHLVMFGEYIPAGNWIPALYELLPISPGLEPGNQQLMFEINRVVFAPNICFESTVPHLVRDMIHQTNAAGQHPDVMLNLTNDGWFWGSAMLDLHLRCNVMRAVEMRRPNLVAANTGISAWISSRGEVRQQLQKRKDGFIVAEVGKATQDSLYLRIGDALAICCCGFGLVACGVSWFRR